MAGEGGKHVVTYRCPVCGARIAVAAPPGEHVVVCPRCGTPHSLSISEEYNVDIVSLGATSGREVASAVGKVAARVVGLPADEAAIKAFLIAVGAVAGIIVGFRIGSAILSKIEGLLGRRS